MVEENSAPSLLLPFPFPHRSDSLSRGVSPSGGLCLVSLLFSLFSRRSAGIPCLGAVFGRIGVFFPNTNTNINQRCSRLHPPYFSMAYRFKPTSYRRVVSSSFQHEGERYLHHTNTHFVFCFSSEELSLPVFTGSETNTHKDPWYSGLKTSVPKNGREPFHSARIDRMETRYSKILPPLREAPLAGICLRVAWRDVSTSVLQQETSANATSLLFLCSKLC